MSTDKEKRVWTDSDMEEAYQAGYYQYEPFKIGLTMFPEWIVKYRKSKHLYTDKQVDAKITEAYKILKELKVPEEYTSKVTCLCLLTLCNILPDTPWVDSTRSSKKNKDMVEYCISHYNLKESSNNRDSFRREGINILLNYSIIDLNPDNTLLGPNSPLTHYAVKERILTRIKRV